MAARKKKAAPKRKAPNPTPPGAAGLEGWVGVRVSVTHDTAGGQVTETGTVESCGLVYFALKPDAGKIYKIPHARVYRIDQA